MIGYYVHHHGSGHLRRMESVTARMRHPVTVLSSVPPPPGGRGPWLRLARDDEGAPGSHVDADAHGTLHWVPVHDAGLATRAAQVVSWIERVRPALMVVDVSVEVGLLARLAGVPVVVAAMPGRRADPAHRLAYEQAEALLAPWPPGLATGWPAGWEEKATFTGGISRFDDRDPGDPGERRDRTGLLLWGAGGSHDLADAVADLRQASPDWEWRVAGPGSPMDAEQVWEQLRTATVVVTHAGQNAVAELAAARAPAVVVADPRPFDEQRQTVERLAALDLAETATAWPRTERWPDLLRRAAARDGSEWTRWSDGSGAARAAALLDGLADRLAPAAGGARAEQP